MRHIAIELIDELRLRTGVSPTALLLGDLAVWDGHVATIVGDGMMAEASINKQTRQVRILPGARMFEQVKASFGESTSYAV